MEPTRCAHLCVTGLVLLFNTRVESQTNNSTVTMIPVPSDQVSNISRYYDQVEFITDFLLKKDGNITTFPSDFTIPPSNNITNILDNYTNQESVETSSSKDNNTKINELQVIPMNSVPASFSSVIDTLPVHPRIPRRSPAKRRYKVRLNRHSTRVNPELPVRFLLPPPINNHKCSGHNATPDPPFNIKPIVISSSTPLIPISAVATPLEHVATAKPLQVKSEQKESSQINIPPNRRVFVPPPPRHLLPPPFSSENLVNQQYSTPQYSLPERNSVGPFSSQNNVYESSTKPHDCDKTNKIEYSSVKPIVVIEDIKEKNNWNSHSSPLPPVHSSSYNEPVRNVELINYNEPVRNVESFNNFPPIEHHNQLLVSTTSENTPLHENSNNPHKDHNNEYETKLCDKNHSSPAYQPLPSDNVTPLNLNNQPLSANDQLFIPNSQDSFQNNEKQPLISEIQQTYTPNNQQPFYNNQLQSSLNNQIHPSNQHHFKQDYQELLSTDNQQTLSTNNPQEFKLNNIPPVNHQEYSHSTPYCNESNQQQFTSDNQYNSQQYALDKKTNQQQLNPYHQHNQQQFPVDKQFNKNQFPTDNQYYQQQLPSDEQKSQQQLIPNNQYNQQFPSDKQYNLPQLHMDNQYNQQQFSADKQYNQQLPSDKNNKYQLNHYTHQHLPADKTYNQQQLNTDNQQQYISNNQYHQQDVNPNDQHNFSPSDEIHYSQTSATQTSVTKEPGPFQSSPFEHYSLKSTTPLPLSSSIEPYPFLRGPNIEQALFETGNFQVGDMSFNNTDDSTVAMMNRPLLTQEVARMGMKITANLKMEQINRAKLNRGKYKYNHLNQFNFPNLDESSRANEVSKSSKLQVAETSYYKDRRGVQELTETPDLSVIPGTPGVDYPTLNRPPLKSDFSCRSVENHRGYVADPSTRCQVFYICVGSGQGEAMLCPNGTLFSQDFLVCDWWFNIDCRPYS